MLLIRIPESVKSEPQCKRSGIAGLLPPDVRCAEAVVDWPSIDAYPSELAALGGCSPARRAEFATGRWCAREALAALGLPPQALPPRETGDPVWPPGFVGSITHCAGYRAAAVGRAADYRALGIDAEPHAGLPTGVLTTVATAAEIDTVRGMPADGTAWDRVLFSSKEAAFKAWFPITHRNIEPSEIAVALHPAGTFAAAIRGLPLDGRWLASWLVLTAVVVRRPPG